MSQFLDLAQVLCQPRRPLPLRFWFGLPSPWTLTRLALRPLPARCAALLRRVLHLKHGHIFVSMGIPPNRQIAMIIPFGR